MQLFLDRKLQGKHKHIFLEGFLHLFLQDLATLPWIMCLRMAFHSGSAQSLTTYNQQTMVMSLHTFPLLCIWWTQTMLHSSPCFFSRIFGHYFHTKPLLYFNGARGGRKTGCWHKNLQGCWISSESLLINFCFPLESSILSNGKIHFKSKKSSWRQSNRAAHSPKFLGAYGKDGLR